MRAGAITSIRVRDRPTRGLESRRMTGNPNMAITENDSFYQIRSSKVPPNLVVNPDSSELLLQDDSMPNALPSVSRLSKSHSKSYHSSQHLNSGTNLTTSSKDQMRTFENKKNMRMTMFGRLVDEDEHREYFEAMKIFEGRDFKQERKLIVKQSDSLTNKNQVSSFAKKGYYVLDQVRG